MYDEIMCSFIAAVILASVVLVKWVNRIINNTLIDCCVWLNLVQWLAERLDTKH